MKEEITRIKVDDKIHYDRTRPDRPIEHCYVDFRSYDAREEFVAALAAIVPFVLDECGLDADLWAEAMITEITFRHSKDGIGFAAGIVRKRELKQPLVQRLPHLPPEDIGVDLQLKLKRLCDEAMHYAKNGGVYAQTELIPSQEEAA